jgi:hypothetical protein
MSWRSRCTVSLRRRRFGREAPVLVEGGAQAVDGRPELALEALPFASGARTTRRKLVRRLRAQAGGRCRSCT